MKKYTITGLVPVEGRPAMCARDHAKTEAEAFALADAMLARLGEPCTVLVAEYHVIRTIGAPLPKPAPRKVEDENG